MLIGMAIYIMLFIYPVWLGSISSPLYPSQPGCWSLLPFLKTNSSHLKHSQKEAGSSTKTHPFSRANWLLVSGRAREKTLYIPQPIGGFWWQNIIQLKGRIFHPWHPWGSDQAPALGHILSFHKAHNALDDRVKIGWTNTNHIEDGWVPTLITLDLCAAKFTETWASIWRRKKLWDLGGRSWWMIIWMPW